MEFRSGTFAAPWEPLPSDQAGSFQAEIERELTPGHLLHGVVLHAIAHSRRADEVLFQLEDGRVAEVHLTWSRQYERPPWPVHQIYSSLNEWQQVMIRDRKVD
jgi:hypothetical protein